MIEKSEGIVLNSIKYGDSSKIITVFTKDFGKLSFIAKGARTPKSKFGASLEILTLSEFTFYYKSNSDLFLLSNSDIIKSNGKLNSNSEGLLMGIMIAEIINNTQEKGHQNIELFEFSINLISELHNNLKYPFNVFNKFMFGLSEIMGFALNNNEIDINLKEAAINFESGCFVSNNLLQKNNFRLNNEEIIYFDKLISGDNIFDFEIDKKSVFHFYDFWTRYFSFHLERKFVLKSAAML